MNGNRPMEIYYGYPNPYSQVNEGYMGFFEGYHHQQHPPQPPPPPPPPPPNYLYPMHSQETAYWSMNINSYTSDFPDVGTTSYYGYQINDAEINRSTWEYPSSIHIEHPTMDTSDGLEEECPMEASDTASPEAAWQDNIDPDNMTYEELLDLGEAVGTQSRGLSQELIKLLPTSRYKAGGFFSRKKSRERCVICLVSYKIGDQQMTLPCKHVYHSKCGKKWLSINKTCPVCNTEVFGEEARS